MVTQFDKALMPLIVGLVLLGLSAFGVTETMTIKEALMALATSLSVYFVPNKA